MICKICGYNERDDTDGFCDDCKVSLISSDDVSANLKNYLPQKKETLKLGC
jgi:hypothetical protein